MKLKEIKPGMVIHLKNQEEYALLMDELDRLGYVWYASVRKPTVENYYPCEVIHTYSDNGFLNITYSMTKGEVAKEITHEFSDLIIEEEMSAYETMQILGKICNEHECIGCPIGKISPGIKCQVLVSQHSDKVFEIFRQWKSYHEKKEPEVEWLWKAYIVVGVYDYYDAETKDEAIKWCEDRVKRFPEVKCTYKRVCRVKGGANER